MNFFDKSKSIIIKGFLVIIMFWSHMFNHPDRIWNNVNWISIGYINGKSIEIILCPFFHIAVPLFFFIGGYGYYLTEKKEGFYSFSSLIFRIKKLYTKYWITFILFIPFCLFRGILTFNLGEFILNFIGISSTYCGEWWFLSTYLEILICFYLFRHLSSKDKNINSVPMIAFSIGIATVGYIMKFVLGKMEIDIEQLFIHEIYYLLIKQPMFVGGYIVAKENLINKVCIEITKYGKKVRVMLNILIGITVLCLPYIVAFIPETYFYIFYTPVFVIGFCLITNTITIFNSLLTKFGNYSTYMWLCHSLLLYKLIQKIIYFPKLSIICWGWLVLITYCISFILSKIEFCVSKIIRHSKI